jgi:O-acetyl-ADP-ribose deacetylase (regulator of RNase III)
MSEGISLEFRRKFGKIDQLIIQQNKQVIEIVFLQENQRYILYIITKEWHTQKPTYETMFFAMKNLRRFCESHNIKKVALPKIGNGCDLLDWEQVRAIIRYVFKNSDIKILIYSIDTYSKGEKTILSRSFIYHR